MRLKVFKTSTTGSYCQFYHEKYLSEIGWFPWLLKDLFLLELFSNVKTGAVISVAYS
jgi:hypothetical protein